MASIVNDPGGRKRLFFYCPDGERRSIRLGKVSQRAADAIKVKVDDLESAIISGCGWKPETARWVAEIPDSLANKLAAKGMIPHRKKDKVELLDAFCDTYIKGRANLKPNTKRNFEATRKRLVDHFGAERSLAEISAGDADDWRETLLKRLSMATVSREVKRARQYFRAAVRKRIITENPFADLASPAQVNSTREFFITADATAKVLEACPNNEWRLIVALSRYGGLRCPSEHLNLKWGDIDWDRGRITVRSPKTAHLAGGGSRIVPLFPELKPYLDQAWVEAKDKAEFVVTCRRDTNTNLRTRFLKIIERAGLKPWPRLFHNLRASRQTELTAQFPLHVVCEWIGNSALIADKHYLQVTDDHYADASRLVTSKQSGAKSGANVAQNRAQWSSVAKGGESQNESTGNKKPRHLPGIVPLVTLSGDSTPIAANGGLILPTGFEPVLPD